MKTVLYMAIAANGAVANHQGGTPWGKASWQNYIRATNAAGNLIMGRTTYDVMERNGEFDPFDPKVKLFVVSSHPAPPKAIAEFVATPAEAIKRLSDFEIIMVAGGPILATSMLKANQLNEIHLDIEPIILGGGVPLIPNQLERHLTLLDIIRYDGGITLKYAVEKAS